MMMDDGFYNAKEEELKVLIRGGQADLWKCEFWGKLFFDVLKRHCYQDEFFLMGENPTKDSVYKNLHRFLKRLKSKYKISCHRETEKNKITFYLGLTKTSSCSMEIRHYLQPEFRIEINRDNIHLHLLPYSGFEKIFSLLDYQIVKNILKDYCKEFFAHTDERYVSFLEFCKRLQNSENKLTSKTSEIARASIESIYNASAEKDKVISHGYISSQMKIGGNDVFILLQDFLEDPQVLIRKLQ